MAGASEETKRVRYVNANWAAGGEADDGEFGLLIVTEDGQRYELQPSPAAMTALLALARATVVLLWDPDGRTLIAANLIGEWLPPTWSAGDRRQPGGRFRRRRHALRFG